MNKSCLKNMQILSNKIGNNLHLTFNIEMLKLL